MGKKIITNFYYKLNLCLINQIDGLILKFILIKFLNDGDVVILTINSGLWWLYCVWS